MGIYTQVGISHPAQFFHHLGIADAMQLTAADSCTTPCGKLSMISAEYSDCYSSKNARLLGACKFIRHTAPANSACD